MDKVGLLSLATALPPHIVEQAVAKAKARELFGGRKELFDRLAGVFDNAGIAQRHIVAPTVWYEGHHGWKERNRLYLDACDALFREAAATAIERAGLQPARHRRRGRRLDHRHRHAQPRCAQRPGDRPSPRRPPRADLRPGLRRRRQRARHRRAPRRRRTGQPLAVRHHRDLLDRHPPRQRRSRGDRRHRHLRRRRRGGGRAAGDGGIATIAGAGERMWPDTLDIMGWRVEDPGLAVVFDRAIPPFVEAELAGAVDGMLRRHGPRPRATSTASAATPAGSR